MSHVTKPLGWWFKPSVLLYWTTVVQLQSATGLGWAAVFGTEPRSKPWSATLLWRRGHSLSAPSAPYMPNDGWMEKLLCHWWGFSLELFSGSQGLNVKLNKSSSLTRRTLSLPWRKSSSSSPSPKGGRCTLLLVTDTPQRKKSPGRCGALFNTTAVRHPDSQSSAWQPAYKSDLLPGRVKLHLGWMTIDSCPSEEGTVHNLVL